MRTGSLCSTTQVATPVSPGSHGSRYAAGVDAPRGERRQQPVRRVDDLDREVVRDDEPFESLGDALQDAARVELGQDRFGDLEELALATELLLEGERLFAESFGRIGVGHRLRREAGIDDEEPKVVIGELVEPELREDEDAEHAIVEDHRREEHRFVEVVLGPRDRRRARVRGRIAEVLGDAMFGDPAGDALAQGEPEHVGRLVDVLTDLAEHRHGDEVLTDQSVDPGVVIVDQLAELAGDRLADLVDAREPAEASPQLLDRLELGRPGGHPFEVLGGPDGD